METTSNKSGKSGSSFHSSASSTNALLRARAKAAATKVRAEYAEQEAKARIEKVKKETEAETLAICREAAEAEAVAAVWESAVSGSNNYIVLDETNSTEQSKLERTSEYIQTHFHSTNSVQQTAMKASSPPTQPITYATLSYSPNNPFVSRHQPPVFSYDSTNNVDFTDYDLDYAPPAAKESVSQNPFTREGPRVIPKTLTSQISDLNIGAPSFNPQPTNTQSMPATEHLAQYLARRDLVNTSLYEFDDKPENYRAWLSSYKNATQGLGLTATEELDLMTRWLGKESSNQVKRLRAVHIASPQIALGKAWERLQECYAAPEVIEKALFTRLDAFPRVSAKENLKLRELADLLMEVQCAKEDGYLPGLSYLDTTRGIEPIVTKLPYGLQEKWISAGSKYKEANGGRFPPFDYFTKLICYEAKKRNDPSFAFLNTTTMSSVRAEGAFPKTFKKPIAVHKINVTPTESNVSSDPSKICPIHAKPHPLKKCKAFRAETLDDRKVFLKENGICFKCCSSTNHMAKDCTTIVKCFECDSTRHISAMHPGPAPHLTTPLTSPQHGWEGEEVNDTSEVSASCTAVCGTGQVGRSCSKICLARVYQKDHPEEAIKAYVVLDDQSNRSLAKSSFFDKFDIHTKPYPYQLKTCSGIVDTFGRRASDFIVESLNGKVRIPLPPLTECNDLPDNRSEIPTPNAALHQPHLSKVAEHIPKLDPTAEILLLLGRDAIRAHKVREQINGPANAPFAQRLDLGWVLVGEVCLGSTHKPNVSSFRTAMVDCHRPSLFQPCTSLLHIKEELHDRLPGNSALPPRAKEHSLGQNVFDCTEQDNKLAPSIEDETFLKMMDKDVYRNDSHSWVAPLPFRLPRQQLPNNREQALKRFGSLQRQFKRKPEMQQQYVEFMGKLLKNNHAEVAPELREEECWYLPSFAVYHPQKPDQIRVVFDSSAQQSGISLNNVLLTGPDLNNTLLGVLMRFRKDKVAVMADIQQMFYCFLVDEKHRNYLRFLWFNGPTFLRKPSVQPDPASVIPQSFSIVSPESDAEVRPAVKSYITDLQGKVLSTERFERFSTFDTLQRAIALLIHIGRSFSTPTGKCKGWHHCDLPRSVDELSQAREVIIRAVQRNTFVKEFEALERGKQVPLSSCLRSLNPVLQDDLLCLGGRLKNADVSIEQKNPVILPKEHHVSLLLTRYHHAQVKHQGRQLTEGAVRAAGLWILGGKRLVNSTIHKCITCRRLRGRMQEQKMADLPTERLTTCPPFTYVGLDVFGPWHVSTRRTRGTQPQSKCWAILFCCMSSRAVHIEVITSMDTSSCINALRRFFAIRGPAKQLRSDCGTNFIGACKELGLSADQPDSTVQRYLQHQGCSWVFNPPHASHMGGSWERLIGLARRILDSTLREHSTRLTHDVLCTLMAEVTAILNARPLVPVSNDPENPFILTPSMLLTQKVGVPPPPGDFTGRDLLTKQWRQVQALSNLFWNRWRQVYLSTLQSRKKWTRSHQNLQDGDIVLLKDNQAARNNWPLAVVTKAIPGTDGRVRKVELKTANQGQPKTYLRPVTETVLLLHKN
ncbi:uncharacterized protein LOC134860115 [Eleginops maclovinus]|uniref:uncharacterized protein LOC134860115 n=1 Tax=Eleginops maclovinus TaxID=56733 RepID=UPI0030800063